MEEEDEEEEGEEENAEEEEDYISGVSSGGNPTCEFRGQRNCKF